MLLSKALQCKYDPEQQQVTTVNLSHKELVQLDDIEPKLRRVNILILNHCELNNLNGIEQFECLQTFSFKFNNIENVKELYKLNCKDSIQSLNFIGNYIQHLHAARFQTLSKAFVNLTELNNTDYRFKKVFKNRNTQGRDCIQTKRIMAKFDQLTKRHIEDTEKKENSFQAANQNISLQNVMITKSVTIPNKQQDRQDNGNLNKKKNLLISTTNAQNIAVYQPTATFARQKQIETTTGFGFTVPTNAITYRQNSILDNTYNNRRDSESDYQEEISNNFQKSRSQLAGYSIFLPEIYENVEQREQEIAISTYEGGLLRKGFAGLKQRTRSRNMPRKRDFC